jgi:hypothetical protein
MAVFQLPNPPDGFEFAKNGLGQETGTLIKSAAATLNDSAKKIASNFPKPPANLFNFTVPVDSNGPSLTDTMNAIKSGAINKDITASLSKIGEVSGSLPADVAGPLAQARADIADKMSAAQAQLPKLMAVAQANMDLTVKMSLASTGQPPSEEQLKQASGALAIFQDGPALLKTQAENISKSVAQAGPAFGASLPAALNSVGNFAKAGLNKVTELATTAGASITSFANSVPSQTIPDPVNPGQTIPNPAYTTFASDPANASKLSSLSSLTTAVSTAAAGLTSAFGAVEAKASAAVAGGIADLKAFAAASQLAQPAGGIMAQVRSIAVDTSKVSSDQINKIISQAAASNPAAPPKPPEAEATKVVKSPDDTTAPTPDSPLPKKAIFDKNPSDKISVAFCQAYLAKVEEGIAWRKQLTATSAYEAKLNAFYPNYVSIRDKGDQIKKAKPDPATRTEEENLIVAKREALKAVATQYFLYRANTTKVWNQVNVRIEQYDLLRKLYFADKRYGDCPRSIETAISTSAVLTDEEEKLYYATYADLIKAKPEAAVPVLG